MYITRVVQNKYVNRLFIGLNYNYASFFCIINIRPFYIISVMLCIRPAHAHAILILGCGYSEGLDGLPEDVAIKDCE